MDADSSGRWKFECFALWNQCVSCGYYLGLIRPLEMFAYFQVEGTVFEKAIFSLFDEGKIVCLLWINVVY